MTKSHEKPLRTLYISYFGALKHLSQAQVIPYLKEISGAGIDVTLLSFEEKLPLPADEQAQRKALRQELSASGIDWHPLRYHKRPSLPATLYDVLQGTIYALALIVRKRIRVVHARNHVPAVIALVAQRVLGTKLLFDMRGVMAEEYVDAGLWTEQSLGFRLTKWIERLVLGKADAIVMLTERIREILRASSPALQGRTTPIEVIPCCVDLTRYASIDGNAVRQKLGLVSRTVMVYIGSLGGWYMDEETVDLFGVGRSIVSDLHFLVLTQSRPDSLLRRFATHGIPASAFTILTVPSREVPGHLAAGDFAISFIKPCYSKIASSPTKMGEYLAAGLPTLCNRGIGDIDALIETERVGVLVDGFDVAAYERALAEMQGLLTQREAVRERCRQAAERHFSLASIGREGYLRTYERLGWERNDPR